MVFFPLAVLGALGIQYQQASQLEGHLATPQAESWGGFRLGLGLGFLTGVTIGTNYGDQVLLGWQTVERFLTMVYELVAARPRVDDKPK
mmetsp:Transcript_80958/g.216091  ORF Transcript_80958/g.216091 Transcript_80958/m.216091 type:complete len:89 (-) Transcript_80958:116-382(-)